MGKSVQVVAEEMTENVNGITLSPADPEYQQTYNEAIAGPLLSSGIPTPIPIEDFIEDHSISVSSMTLTPVDLAKSLTEGLSYVLGVDEFPEFTLRTIPDFSTIHASDYGLAFKDGLFLLANGTKVQTSADGFTWSSEIAATFEGSTNLDGKIAAGAGLFVGPAANNKILYSRNATDWKIADYLINIPTEVAYGPRGGFLMFAAGDSEFPFMSPSGERWTAANGFSEGTVVGIAYGGDSYVMIVDDGSILRSNSSALTQLARNSDSTPWTSIAFYAGTFVAVSSDGRASKSTDNGITWVDFDLDLSKSFSCVIGARGCWLAAGSGSILASRDLETWTEIFTFPDYALKMVYAEDVFVGILAGGSDRLMTGVLSGSMEWGFV